MLSSCHILFPCPGNANPPPLVGILEGLSSGIVRCDQVMVPVVGCATIPGLCFSFCVFHDLYYVGTYANHFELRSYNYLW